MFNDNKERLDKITSSYNVILNVVGKKCGIEISNYNDYRRLSKFDREKLNQSLKTELEYKNDHYIVDALKTINSNCASNYIIAQGEKVSSFDKFITLGNELVNHPKKVVKMNKKDKKDSDNKKGNKKKPRKGLFGFLSRLFTKAELPEVSLGNNTNNNSANSNNATNTNNDSNNNPVPEQSTPEVENQEENNKLPELYPIGLALGTYIVCQNELGVYLIDQHAAKERINYEIVLYNLSHPNSNVMTPLIPINIELPLNEYLIIKQNIEILNKINIQVEEFGSSSFRVISHPTWINKGFEVQTIKHIFEMIVRDEKNFSLERFIDNVAKMVSCKMSIKGNTRINIEEMESLINDLRKCNNPFNCPHGRPTIIHFTIYELEKMFKRSI